jgi:hypothetical protein
MAPTAEEIAVAEMWLGGEHDGTSVQVPTREEALRGFLLGYWTLDDIPNTSRLPTNDELEIFRLAFVERRAAAEAAGEVSVEITPLLFRRFVMWLRKAYVPSTEPGSLESVPEVMSDCEKADSKAQGAEGVRGHVAFVDLSVFLGRAATEHEALGLEYGGNVAGSAPATRARKGKLTNFDEVIGQAEKDGRITLVSDFVSLLEDRLMDCPQLERAGGAQND